jgi:hypothetical protein
MINKARHDNCAYEEKGDRHLFGCEEGKLGIARGKRGKAIYEKKSASTNEGRKKGTGNLKAIYEKKSASTNDAR